MTCSTHLEWTMAPGVLWPFPCFLDSELALGACAGQSQNSCGRSKHQVKQTDHVTRNLAVVQVFEMPKRIQISTPIPHFWSSKDLAQLKSFRNSTLEVLKRMVYTSSFIQISFQSTCESHLILGRFRWWRDGEMSGWVTMFAPAFVV